MAIVSYLLLCVIAGVVGRDTRIGFWGVTFLSIFLTPVIGLMFLMIFGQRGSRV